MFSSVKQNKTISVLLQQPNRKKKTKSYNNAIFCLIHVDFSLQKATDELGKIMLLKHFNSFAQDFSSPNKISFSLKEIYQEKFSFLRVKQNSSAVNYRFCRQYGKTAYVANVIVIVACFGRTW